MSTALTRTAKGEGKPFGITAGLGPGFSKQRAEGGIERQFYGYVARGVPFGPDDGILAPWAAVASLPFAPEIVLAALRHFRDVHPEILGADGLLITIPKTPLYERLRKDGRLAADPDVQDNTKLGINVIPKQMGYEEMVSGYRSLYISLLEDRTIADRIKNKIRYFSGPPDNSTDSFGEQFLILMRLLIHGLMPGGMTRMFHFVRSIPFSRPKLIPLAIGDWVVGLTMRDYVDRQLAPDPEESHELTEEPLGVGAALGESGIH